MLIKSLKLENIRSYSNLKIDFPKGSTVLSGDIGSGKTTLLLAIEFALFGIRRKHLDGSNLLRYGKKEGSVSLKFEVDGKEVKIKRKLKRSKSDIKQVAGYISINGKRKDATAVELKTKVLDLLGYPQDLVTKTKNLIYRYTVYTPQEEMKHILMEEGRIDTLRKVFGIDKYKRIRENSQILIREIKDRKKLLQLKIESLQDKKSQLMEHTKQFDSMKKELEEVEKKLKITISELKDQKNKQEHMESMIKELERLRKEIQNLDERLKEKVESNKAVKEDIDSNMAAIKDIKDKISNFSIKSPSDMSEEELEKDISQKEDRLRGIIQEETSIREQLSSTEERIRSLDEEIKEKSARLDSFEEKMKGISKLKQAIAEKDSLKNILQGSEKELESIKQEQHIAEANMANSRNLLSKISELKSCPTCLQPVSKEHKHEVNETESKKVSILQSNISSLKKSRLELSKEIESAKKELEHISEKEKSLIKLESEQKMLNTLQKDISEKGEKREKLSIKRAELKERLDELSKIDKKSSSKEIAEKKLLLKNIREYLSKKKDLDHLKEMLSEKESFQEKLLDRLTDIKKSIGNINASKLEISSKIKKYSDVEKEHDTLRRVMDETREKEKESSVKRKVLETEIGHKKDKLAELEKDIHNMEKIKEKLAYLQQLHSWMDSYFINLMAVMEKNVMLTVYNEFNRLFQSWFDTLIEDESMQARLDEQFTPIIIQNGHDAPISNLSGGEKTAAALAYRLALNKVVNDLMSKIKTKGIIILDEPTDGFSAEQLDKVRDVLKELDIKQTLLVSHESKIESFVDNIIRVSKSEGLSQALQ